MFMVIAFNAIEGQADGGWSGPQPGDTLGSEGYAAMGTMPNLMACTAIWGYSYMQA